jgi:hypothetical protein
MLTNVYVKFHDPNLIIYGAKLKISGRTDLSSIEKIRIPKESPTRHN